MSKTTERAEREAELARLRLMEEAVQVFNAERHALIGKHPRTQQDETRLAFLTELMRACYPAVTEGEWLVLEKLVADSRARAERIAAILGRLDAMQDKPRKRKSRTRIPTPSPSVVSPMDETPTPHPET